MEDRKLYEGERRLMELLWDNEGATAKALSLLASERIGWNKNTTYTVIGKLVEKGVIRRTEPGFICHSTVGREAAGLGEARQVLNTFFGGSVGALFSSFMADGALSGEEAEELRRLIDKRSGE